MKLTELVTASTRHIPIKKVNGMYATPLSDVLAVEEPLEIRVRNVQAGKLAQKNISVTMRTPGNDADLAIGFLFTEGIITAYVDVKSVGHLGMACESKKENIIVVDLADGFVPRLMQADRNFYTTSSCGVCGKSAIESIRTASPFAGLPKPGLFLSTEVLYRLPAKLKAAQHSFEVTGGIHASGLFTLAGDLALLCEDVGRHNALDKLVGAALAGGLLPLRQYILLLSGRASFELIQKAAMAGIPVVAAIGAPSSLAVDLAQELDITLLGFLKDNRFNIYHQSNHVTIPMLYEDQD